MNLNWQNEVLRSRSKYIISKTPRRSGKTFTGIRWARAQEGKRVLFITHSQQTAKMIIDAAEVMYRNEIIATQKGEDAYILFQDGTSIFFTSGYDMHLIRGRLVESAVVDDVEAFDEDYYNALAPCISEQFLFLGSTVNDFVMNLMKQVPGVHYIQEDYLDLLEEGHYTKDEIRELSEVMSPAQFKKEFGPWHKDKRTNKDFVGLLYK